MSDRVDSDVLQHMDELNKPWVERFTVQLRGCTETVTRQQLERILSNLSDLKGLTFTVVKK